MQSILALGVAASVLLGSAAHDAGAPRQSHSSVQHMQGASSSNASMARCNAATDYGDANGIALDARGHIYTALGAAYAYGVGAAGVELRKWSPAGRLLAAWTTPGARRGEEQHPVGIAVDPRGNSGNIYVSDPNAGHIDKLSATGRVLAAWGAKGMAPGQFDTPAGIAIDRHGDVYVADEGNGRVQVFDAARRLRAVWRLPAARRLRAVWRLPAARRLRAVWRLPAPHPGQASRPSGIAVDWHGRVYVADDAIRILVLSPQGKVLRAWGSKGDEPDEFRHPVGIALDPRGRLDIADKLNGRIQRFSGAGKPLTRWATGAEATGWFKAQGAAPAQPAFPTGVAVAASGAI